MISSLDLNKLISITFYIFWQVQIHFFIQKISKFLYKIKKTIIFMLFDTKKLPKIKKKLFFLFSSISLLNPL